MKKTKLIALLCSLLLVATLLLSGCTLFDYGDEDKSTALATPLQVQYTMYTVVRGDISKSFTGMCEVMSFKSEKCYFDSSIPASAVFQGYEVKVGSEVKSGDLLCTAIDGSTTYEIRAPFDGTVRYVNSDYANQKSTNKKMTDTSALMAVVSSEAKEDLQGVMRISSQSLDNYGIVVGTKVSMYITGSSTTDRVTFDGEVIGSSYVVEEDEGHGWWSDDDSEEDSSSSTTEKLYIDISNAPDDITVGTSLSVTYVEQEVKDVLKIPVSALGTYDNKYFVYVLDSTGIKREKYISIGMQSDTFVEVTEGLSEGDLIIQY